MANWDRADCLLRLARALRRPQTDAELPTSGNGTLADELLGNAQIEIAERLAMYAPESNYSVISLTTSDNKVYSTASVLVEWLGKIEVYRDNTLKGFPMSIGAAWDCRKDWTVEGTRSIRLTCGRSKSYPTLSARAFVKPAELDASRNFVPSLQPESLLECTIYLAAANFCDGGGKRDPAPFLRQLERRFANAVSVLKPNQSTGIPAGYGWWNLTGDLGRLG